MILQSLVDYYDRSDDVAPSGWERKRIPFFIEISLEGEFLQLTPMKFGPRATDVPAQLVPTSEIRAGIKSYEKPNLLWDHIGFVIGHPKSDELKDIANAEKQLEHFRRRVGDLAKQAPHSPGVQAVDRFYARQEYLRVREDSCWKDCVAIPGCNVTFRLAGKISIIVQDQSIRSLLAEQGVDEAGDAKGICLVTGNLETIATLHPKISNVADKPTALAAVNDQSLPALASYGKHQGENFPVSTAAAFKYATALNHLLRPNSPQKISVGDATAIFWSANNDEDYSEAWLADLVSGGNPDAHAQQVKALFESVRVGAFDGARGENKFFVLGLAPNSARIVIRFWHAAPLREIAKEVARWFHDIEVCGSSERGEYPGIYRLLSSICMATRERPQGDISKLPSLVIWQTFRAAFTGSPLPVLLLQSALIRIRSDQAKKDDAGKPVRHVSPARVAILKAYLNRHQRAQLSKQKEITVSLDKTNSEPPYLWGRMFAVYERMQEQGAERELNRTIRDAYFGSAMATPRSVYNRLAKLNQIHLRELKRSRPGAGEYFDRLLLEISGKMSSSAAIAFPAQSTPEQQASFAIGYYHQRQDFFTKRDSAETESTTQTETAH